jgi:hypothetical protein
MSMIIARHAIPRLKALMRASGLEESAAALKHVQLQRNRTYPSSTKIESIVYRYELMRHNMAREIIDALNHTRRENKFDEYSYPANIVEFNSRIVNLGSHLHEYVDRNSDPEVDPIADVARRCGLTQPVIESLCANNQYLLPIETINSIVAAASLVCRKPIAEFTIETRDVLEREFVPIPQVEVRKIILEAPPSNAA